MKPKYLRLKQPISELRIPWLPWLVWTLWFLLDPALNRFGNGLEWVFPLSVMAWALGMVILALLSALFWRYGLAAVVLSCMGIFLLLWGLGELLPEVVLPNPYHLSDLWRSAAMGMESYLLFLTWLEGWVVCLAAILLAARQFCKKFPPAEQQNL